MSIGYACLTIGVPNTGLSRCILKNATEENLRYIIEKNLTALHAMIKYNMANEIRLFRISSDIIPFGSHKVNAITWWEDYKEYFEKIEATIKKAGIRVSMHPGQYTVLNSKDPKIVENALADLNYHGRFLEALGTDQTSKIVLHIGGVYGNKEEAMKTFIENYVKLPEMVKKRLIIENDDKNYTIQDVMEISEKTKAPVVFDNLHNALNPAQETKRSEYDWIIESNKTWKPEDGRQKIHYSQKKEGASFGSHSDTVFIKPFLSFYEGLPDKTIDIMLEVKDKNLSAMKCIKTTKEEGTPALLEGEWERYEYFILSRSPKLYHKLKSLSNENDDITLQFYDLIETALALPEEREAEIKAAQTIWSFFEKDSFAAERNRYNKLIEAYENNTGAIKPVKNHLLKCAQLREKEALINSLYFYL